MTGSNVAATAFTCGPNDASTDASTDRTEANRTSTNPTRADFANELRVPNRVPPISRSWAAPFVPASGEFPISAERPAGFRYGAFVQGRATEQALLRGVIERTRLGAPEVFMLRGAAGIGKSTLLNDLCGSIDDALLITATGIESEHRLPLAGLIEMFHPLRAWLDLLESPHREVLIRAVDRGESSSPVVLGLAVLHCIELLDKTHNAIVAVLDDFHWFDEESASSIQFAFRRLTNERVALLLAARPGESTGFASGFAGVSVTDIGGVDDAASHWILSSFGDVSLSVARTARIACGGNPLALEQLGRILSPEQRRGVLPLPDPIPMGERLTSVLQARVADLPDATQRALVVLALTGGTDRIWASSIFTALGISAGDFVAAEDCGVVVREPGGFVFSHPLLRSAALAQADDALRRGVHRAVARSLPADEVERRAYHLDLGSEGSDPTAAEVLEQAAGLAAKRCDFHAAARAWERAARHSATRIDTARRLGEAGSAMWRANRPDLGIPFSEEAWGLLEPGELRATITLNLADMISFWQDSTRGIQLLIDEARSIDDRSPAVAASLLSTAANLVALQGDFRRAVELSVASEGVARLADAETQLGCRALTTHLRLLHGEIRDLDDSLPDLAALATFVGPGCPESLVTLGQLVVFDRLALAQWEGADELAARVITEARAVGLRGVEIFTHAIRGEVAWRRGRWIETRAESLIEIQHNDESEVPVSSFGHATLARVEAGLGMVESSKHNARLAIEQGQRVGLGALEAWGRHALALALIAEDDYSGAVLNLEWISDLCTRGEIREPGTLWWQGDLVEALWRRGRAGDAQRVVDTLKVDFERTGSGWAAAIAARGSGLLLSDASALRESAAILDQIEAPFEAARSRALMAEIADHRRTLPELEQALTVFEQLGARPWVRRTSRLLGTRSEAELRSEAAVSVLSKAELRVALAVARGMSNRACADTLSLSPKTVDAHLQHIYRKLAVNSRTELALLIDRSVQPVRSRK